MLHKMTARGSRGAVLVGVVAALSLTLAACGNNNKSGSSGSSGSGSATTGGTSGKTYKIFMTNNFIDNDYRQQMEKTLKLAGGRAPYAGRVALTVRNSEVAPEAQISTLNNMIQQKPDAILMEAASGTAINPTIQRACSAGIVVITFDTTATAPCAFKVSSNYNSFAKVHGAWFCDVAGAGPIAVDRGLPGNPTSATLVNGVQQVWKKNCPNLKLAGFFNGSFNAAQEQQGITAVLAKDPNIIGAYTQYTGYSTLQAFKQAGKSGGLLNGTLNNRAATMCTSTKGAKCIFYDSSPGVGVLALQVALDVLNKKRPNNGATTNPNGPKARYFTNVPLSALPSLKGYNIQELKEGRDFFPKEAPSLDLPILPAEVPSALKISPAEVAP
jgi:ribose transport system substrate-binding protein